MTRARQTSFDETPVTGGSIFGAAGRPPRPKPTMTRTTQGALISGMAPSICPNPEVFRFRDDRADERGRADRKLFTF